MAKSRGVLNRSLSVLPLLVMGASHLSLPPLQTMFELEPRLMYAWYLVAVLIGVVVYRRSGVVKDHEYNRAKAMRKIKHVYEAEERGVWATDAQLDGTMDPLNKHGLTRSVGEISGKVRKWNWATRPKSKSKCSAKRPHRQSQRPSYRKCHVGRRNRCWYHGCQQENQPHGSIFGRSLWSVWRRQQGRTRGSASSKVAASRCGITGYSTTPRGSASPR